MMAVAVFLTSCEQESIAEEDLEGLRLSSLLADYPEEITIDNWEEFVYVPQQVIDYHQKKELSTIASPSIQSQELQSSIESRTPCGPNGDCGFVKAYNTNIGWDCLGDVFVQGGGCSDESFKNCWNTSGVTHDNNYIVCPGGAICMSYSTTWINGVSTLDLVFIQRHLLGLQPFTDVRQYVAADIDGDGDIGITDLILLRKLIIGTYTSIPGRKNIVFLPEIEYNEASQNLDPDHFMELSDYPDCNTYENRYAIKIGDVNGTFSFNLEEN